MSLGFSVLVADPDPDSRELLAAPLKDAGYAVRVAENDEQALAALAGGSVQLALLNLDLPAAGGLDVLRQVRALRSSRELPVIMVADDMDDPAVVLALREGANDFVAKPLDIPVTLARVMAHLKSCFPDNKPGDDEVSLYDEVIPGLTVDSRYRLTKLLGEGQHGAVWKATHMQLNRPVALKLLRTGVADDDLNERFRREGISACKVDHPNAVSILDAGVTENDVPFLVMELLEGHSLSDEIDGGQRLSPERVADVLIPICEVLHQVHAVSVIHRDIKPQNIFLHATRTGEVVKVLDFGIAKLVDDGTKQLTMDGGGPGTPAYMAPERLAGNDYDGRADVYSLGVMLYRMLSGKMPFDEPNPVRLAMLHLQAAPTPLHQVLPEVDRTVETVVMRTLEKDPERRPIAAALAHLFAAAVGRKSPSFPNLQDWELL